MKKLTCLLLALVLIFALAGCKVANRPRYAAPYGTEKKTYDSYGGTHRSRLRPRLINPGDAPLYDNSLYKTDPRSPATGRTTVTSPAAPLPAATSPAPRTTVTPNSPNRSFNVPG